VQDSGQMDMGERYKNWMNALVWQVVIAIMVGKDVAGETYLKKLEEAFYNYGIRCTDYWIETRG
jgi:hypothetical protein